MWRVRKEDFWAGLFALAGVLLIDVLAGIIIGVVLSLLILIYRSSSPSVTELGRVAEGDRNTFVSIDEFPAATRTREIVAHRFNASLIFSNADAFTDSVLDMRYDATLPARVVVIDCEMMSDMDMTGAAKLGELLDQLRGSGVDVRVSRLHGDARAVAQRDGVLDVIGQDHVHLTVADAVAAAWGEVQERPNASDPTASSSGDESSGTHE